MEKKQNANKLISSLVALSLATTLGVPTIALAEGTDDGNSGGASSSAVTPAQGEEEGGGTGSTVAKSLPEASSEGEIIISEGGTYSIANDIKASIVVNAGVTATINIAPGVTLANKDGRHTITNNGTLTITGGGTVDNVSDGRGALVNEPGATATIKGGTFTRSAETGTGPDKSQRGENSWYTIKNYGSMTFDDNPTVTAGKSDAVGKYSSLVANGWQNDNDLKAHPKVEGQTTASMTIKNGDFSRGLNTIKNDDWGELTISGGTFSNTIQGALQNHHIATVNGGTFNSSATAEAILNDGNACNANADGDQHKLTITGGTFNGAIKKNIGEITVTGGTFTDPSVYQYAQSGEIDVNLTKDFTGDIVVPAQVTSTLNLNGHKITNISNHTIVNEGILTIDGSGTVDNITHEKAAVYNTGTATLKSGTFERSKEAGENKDNNGGNSFYTLLNHGKMTVEDNVIANNKGHYSSLFENGYQSYKSKDGIDAPELVINGGVFDGGINTVKNDDDAVLTINGGTFKNYTQAAFQNHNIAAVTNGTFIAKSLYAIDNCGCDKTHDLGKLAISGGTFTGTLLIRSGNSDVSISNGSFTGNISVVTSTDKLAITGGTFSSDPSAYVADGYEAVKSGESWVVQVPYTPAPAPTTETTTTTNPDGTTTTTVTDKKTGESTATTEGDNGTTVVEKTDASGATTTEITVPADTAAAAEGPVEVPAAIEVAEDQAVSVSAPAGTVVAIPVSDENAGNVAVIVHADGTEEPIPMSLVEDGKIVVKIDGNETIKVVNNAKDFEDVADEHWAADDIDFASSHAIFLGIANGSTYEPETALTRNMMMTVLARVDGADTEDSDPWYAKGQAWAVENGVSNGLWGEDSITREQLVTMLFNYANKAGLDTTARADMSSFPDATGVSPWATDAVSWAVAEGILKGVDNTYVAPQGWATRAQAAAFMQRYVHAALL